MQKVVNYSNRISEILLQSKDFADAKQEIFELIKQAKARDERDEFEMALALKTLEIWFLLKR
jgi:hypothetical protein